MDEGIRRDAGSYLVNRRPVGEDEPEARSIGLCLTRRRVVHLEVDLRAGRNETGETVREYQWLVAGHVATERAETPTRIR